MERGFVVAVSQRTAGYITNEPNMYGSDERQKERTPPMDIVTVQNLKKTFGKGANKVEALRGIDLSVEKGSFTAIIGASGSVVMTSKI